MVRFRGREENIDLPVLVLEDYFCAILIGIHLQNRVVGLVFHYHIFVFDMVEFKLGSIVEHNQESFVHEVLGDQFLCLEREYFGLLVSLGGLDFVKIELVLV